METNQIAIYLKGEERSWLKELAAIEGLSRSGMVRMMIKLRYFEHMKKKVDNNLKEEYTKVTVNDGNTSYVENAKENGEKVNGQDAGEGTNEDSKA